MKMRLLYILYCAPHPCNVTARILSTFAILYRLICRSPPHPAFLLAGAAAHYPHPAFLLAGAAAHYESRCWLPEGEGGRLVLHHYI